MNDTNRNDTKQNEKCQNDTDRNEKCQNDANPRKKKFTLPKPRLVISAGIIIVIVIVLAVIPLLVHLGKTDDERVKIITVPTLKKIINVSELSTFTAVYNGIAEVKNEKKPEQTDYYVSYAARVKAGIDFEEIDISVDDSSKAIEVKIPNVHITDINVDISSMDFIFRNKKVDETAISAQAYKACEADVENESKEQTAILELAHQNAVNIITALIGPIIEQLDAGYTLLVE